MPGRRTPPPAASRQGAGRQPPDFFHAHGAPPTRPQRAAAAAAHSRAAPFSGLDISLTHFDGGGAHAARPFAETPVRGRQRYDMGRKTYTAFRLGLAVACILVAYATFMFVAPAVYTPERVTAAGDAYEAVRDGFWTAAGKYNGTSGADTGRYAIGTVLRVIDGDTIADAGGKYRLALVNTPEAGQRGYAEATAFTSSACPAGSEFAFDRDDLQPADKYGRTVAKVWCGSAALDAVRSGADPGKSVNELLLEEGHACIFAGFIGKSEFGGEGWVDRRLAC